MLTSRVWFQSYSGRTARSSLFTLKFHLLQHLVDDLEMFESNIRIEADPSAHFSVLIKKPYRKTSLQLSLKVAETVHNQSDALHCVEGKRREGVGVDVELSYQASDIFWKATKNIWYMKGSACNWKRCWGYYEQRRRLVFRKLLCTDYYTADYKGGCAVFLQWRKKTDFRG